MARIPKKGTAGRLVYVKLDKDLVVRVFEEAREDDRPVSAHVNRLIRKYYESIDGQKPKPGV